MLPTAGVVIPPDHLLAAKVKGDRAALRDALQARGNAIAIVRRFCQELATLDPAAIPGAGPA